jgi:hypothetical protein
MDLAQFIEAGLLRDLVTPCLLANSCCEVGLCGPSGLCVVVVGGFSNTLEVLEGEGQLINLVVLDVAPPD